MLGIVGQNATLHDVAVEANERLRRVVETLKAGHSSCIASVQIGMPVSGYPFGYDWEIV